jgi:hypothetical protein
MQFFILFILLPLTTALAACLSMGAAFLISKKRVVGAVKEAMSEVFDGSDSPLNEVSGMMDERLDGVMAKFKAKIPLAGMFLSKEKEDSLKEVAKGELMKALPILKDKLLSQGMKGDSIFSRVGSKVFRKIWCFLFGWCAACGFVFGLLQGGIYLILH